MTEHQGDSAGERMIHPSAQTPVIAVACDDPAHNEPFIVARFGKPPAGTWIAFGTVTGQDWLPLPLFYDAAVNPERQHLSRAVDLADRPGRYRLECKKHRRRQTVPIQQEKINSLLDAALAAGRISVTLSELATKLRR